MTWRVFRRAVHVVREHGIAAASGIVLCGIIIYQRQKYDGVEHAAWVTNHNPSVTWDSDWDKREPDSLTKPNKDDKNRDNEKKKNTATAVRHLILIRHGQYNMDAPDDSGRNLTALGREQAHFTGERLKELGFPYDKLISSTMTRAVETAGIIHKYVPELKWDQTDMLREGAPIPPEPPIGHWREERHFHEDGPRIEAAFRKYFHRASSDQKTDSYEIIVCHANVIRYMVCRALQFPPEGWLRLGLPHASLTWITIRPSGRVTLRGLGDSGHIPSSKMTVI